MISKKIMLSFATIIMVSNAAQAEEMKNSGTYVSGSIGINSVQDSDLKFAGISGEAEFDKGFGVTLAVGKRWKENFRIEAEASYNQSKIDSISVGGFPFTANETATAIGLMGNIYRDFKTDSRATPYLGLGLGANRIEVDGDNDIVFAYQGIAGVSFDIKSKTQLALEYKYTGTQDADLGGVDAEYGAHFLGAKLTYNF